MQFWMLKSQFDLSVNFSKKVLSGEGHEALQPLEALDNFSVSYLVTVINEIKMYRYIVI